MSQVIKKFLPQKGYLLTADSLESVTILVPDFIEGMALIKRKGQIMTAPVDRLRAIQNGMYEFGDEEVSVIYG